jgi:hypothetical protein
LKQTQSLSKRIQKIVLVFAFVLVLSAASVRAAPEGPGFGTSVLTPLLSSIIGNVNAIGDDAFSTVDPSTLSPPPTQHYGPYTTTNDADSGTCGNDWATDAFTRFFSIFSQSGSIVVVEQFKDGTFVTPAPAGAATPMSPGACNNGAPYDGGIVSPGITGQFHGYEIIPIPPGVMQTSNDPSCVAGVPSAPCTTAEFIDTHFTPACMIDFTLGACFVTTFFFHYAAGDQGLIANSWTDSSSDRAGEIGDIKSATV